MLRELILRYGVFESKIKPVVLVTSSVSERHQRIHVFVSSELFSLSPITLTSSTIKIMSNLDSISIHHAA